MAPNRVGIAGAGTMGAGIAQLACLAGFETILHDPLPAGLEAGLSSVERGVTRGAERGRWSDAEAGEARRRLATADRLDGLGHCDLVIEAAPEDLGLKRELFRALERCAPEAILATNTSSLAVGDIAAACGRPERVCGMHFFNPPALMTLVEIVAAERTSAGALATVTEAAERMGRKPIRCTDTPGFIVNRCNRPFTLEALQMLGDGVAGPDEIDLVVREDGGYRMGPFELIDLIGVDVNLEVARSLYRQRPLARWRPNPMQADLVAAGRLGRKSGHGFYRYDDGGQALAEPVAPPADLRRAVLERLISALVNEACFAAGEGVAPPHEIDTAMQLGLNHPRGPFQWSRRLGAGRAVATLEALGRGNAERYEVAPLLRELADRN